MTPLAQLPICWTEAPHSDADTSRAAAKQIVSQLQHLEARVFGFLNQRGAAGATAQEIEDGLKMDGSTVRPRLVTLRARGLVKDSGLRRRTHSLRKAVVWVAT